jgi:hypothetical protein
MSFNGLTGSPSISHFLQERLGFSSVVVSNNEYT